MMKFFEESSSWRAPRGQPLGATAPVPLAQKKEFRVLDQIRFGAHGKVFSAQENNLPEKRSCSEEEVLQREQQALATGYQRGMEDGQSQAQAAFNAEPILAFAEVLEQIRRESREVIVELAVAMARKILDQQIELAPDWVARNAEACLQRKVPNGPVKLLLHPQDREFILGLDPRPLFLSAAGPAVEFVADPRLARGDCLLESERMRIDCRILSQVEQLKTVLEDAIAGTLFAEDP